MHPYKTGRLALPVHEVLVGMTNSTRLGAPSRGVCHRHVGRMERWPPPAPGPPPPSAAQLFRVDPGWTSGVHRMPCWVSPQRRGCSPSKSCFAGCASWGGARSVCTVPCVLEDLKHQPGLQGLRGPPQLCVERGHTSSHAHTSLAFSPQPRALSHLGGSSSASTQHSSSSHS